MSCNSSNLVQGIVGLPNVGKSSLFNLLGDSAEAEAENYPFCTIDPNETRCSVPDARYSHDSSWLLHDCHCCTRYSALCDIWQPPSQYPPYLHLVDIAGLIKGASTGAGLGNAFLSHIQAVDGIFHVVRAFENADVTHVEDSVDPARGEAIRHRYHPTPTHPPTLQTLTPSPPSCVPRTWSMWPASEQPGSLMFARTPK